MTRVAWWPHDENAGDTVGDNEASPVNLTRTSGTWGSLASGIGVEGMYCEGSATGTKIETACEGRTTFTFTYAIDLSPSDATAYRTYGGVYTGSADVWFWAQTTSDMLGLYLAGSVLVSEADTSGVSDGYHVIEIVWDTGHATQDERVRWYCDGVQLPSTCNLAQNATITSSTWVVQEGGENGEGDFYAALLDDAAYDDTKVADIAAALLADNDADPEAGGPTPIEKTVTQTQVPERQRTLSRALSVTQTQIMTVARSTSLTRTVTQAQVPALTRGIALERELSAQHGHDASLEQATPDEVTISTIQTQAPSLTREIIRTRDATATQDPSRARELSLSRSATAAQEGSRSCALATERVAVQSQVPTATRGATDLVRELSITQTQVGSTSKSFARELPAVTQTQVPSQTHESTDPPETADGEGLSLRGRLRRPSRR